MKQQSIFSNSFKKLIASILLASEIVGSIYIFSNMYHALNRVDALLQTQKITQEVHLSKITSIKTSASEQFIGLNILILISIFLSIVFLRREEKNIKSIYKDFGKTIENVIKDQTLMKLEDKLNYKEFEEISSILNNMLLENYQKNYYDKLTGLANQNLFVIEVEKLRRLSNKKVILTYIYISNYEELLKNYSFLIADQIILEQTSRLIACSKLFDNTIIARANGNGFLFATYCTNVDHNICFNKIADEMKSSLSKSIDLANIGYFDQYISLGFDLLEEKNINHAIENVYKAALFSNSLNNQKFCYFSDELDKQIEFKNQLELDLNQALESNDLFVYYQPKMNADGTQLLGAEALLRWKRHGIFENTERFIKLAEQTSLIIKIERFVIKTVIKDLKFLKSLNTGIKISINISAKHLRSNYLLDYLVELCKLNDIEHSLIEIELSERINFTKEDIEILSQIKNAGFYISIDDFGKEHNTIEFLEKLPIDAIKIDKSFVSGLRLENNQMVNENSKAIIDNIIKISRKLDKDLIAEGVEFKEQIQYLEAMGCKQFQGFFYHHGALCLDEFIINFINNSYKQ